MLGCLVGLELIAAIMSDHAGLCCCIPRNAARLRCKDSKMINFADVGLRDNVAQVLVLEEAGGFDACSWQLSCLMKLLWFNL